MSTLEEKILHNVSKATEDAIKQTLTQYNSPLITLCESIIREHEDELRATLRGAFSAAIHKPSFKAAINDAMTKKIARLFISANEGVIEKEFSKFKNDPVLKAKVLLYIENILNQEKEEKDNGNN